jgi:serine/threonine-protein kinase
VKPGDVLAGKYVVEEVLGAGGMGVVVAAKHQQLGERVAVKFLRPIYAVQVEIVERFLREARAAVRIKSEHVARIIDVGTMETGAPYMVMEHLVGTDLDELLEREGPLSPARAAGYVLQAAEALAHAHVLGIVHRDLKPANLFLTRRVDGSPVVKILDFGISKDETTTDTSRALTATSAILGSPHYMSPEHARDAKNVDARADVWSLGVVLYELCTGKRPFDGDSVAVIFSGILNDTPRPMRALRADVPAEMDAVVARCLIKDREERIQNVAELAELLAPFAPEEAKVHLPRITSIQRPFTRTERPPPPASSDSAPNSGPLSVPRSDTGPNALVERPRSAVDGGTLRMASSSRGAPARSRAPKAALAAVAVFAVGGALYGGIRLMGQPSSGASASNAPSSSATPSAIAALVDVSATASASSARAVPVASQEAAPSSTTRVAGNAALEVVTPTPAIGSSARRDVTSVVPGRVAAARSAAPITTSAAVASTPRAPPPPPSSTAPAAKSTSDVLDTR